MVFRLKQIFSQEKILKIVITILLVLGVFLLVIPSLIGTLYAYPVQDDFYHARVAREYMSEGHNAFSMAMTMTMKNYLNTKPFYTSMFLMWFLSGILDCSIWGIRIFMFFNTVLFYGSVYFFMHMLISRVMKWGKHMALPVYFLLLSCLQCLIYYEDHEDLYWFCASVGYLSELAMMFLGVALFIYAIDRKSKAGLAGAAIFGFLAAGGALNVTAFCCILYMIFMLWGCMSRQGKWRYALTGMAVTLTGALLNAMAPANFTRRGTPVSFIDVWEAIKSSFAWVFGRFELLLKYDTLFLTILLVLLIISLGAREMKYEFGFPMPALVSVIMLVMCAVIVFPVILGYGKDVYPLLNRAQFVSDLASYTFIFLLLLYWGGWFGHKFSSNNIIKKNSRVIFLIGMCIFAIGVKVSNFGNYPAVKQFKNWSSGEYRRYSDCVIGMYNQIAEASGDPAIAIVSKEEIVDRTCLVPPAIFMGEYDPLEIYGNKTIAEYYGKSAVYIYEKD